MRGRGGGFGEEGADGGGPLGGEGHLLLGVVLGGGGDHGRIRSLRFRVVLRGRKWGCGEGGGRRRERW